jgi:bacillopeptidase F (M6 metalloprotease family)
VFDSWLDTEVAPWDGVNIQISTDLGTNWNPVTTVTPAYNATVDAQQCWSGHTWAAGWQTFQADLSAYANQIIMVRLQLRSDTAVTAPGWYIDNVRIMD